MFLAFFVVFGPDIVFGTLLALLWVARVIFECVMAILIGGLDLVAWGLARFERHSSPAEK